MKNLLILAVCTAAIGAALPPLPGGKPVLQSPKGAEFQKSLAVAPVAPPVTRTNHMLITWENKNVIPVGFIVEARKIGTTNWFPIYNGTNTSYDYYTTNGALLFRASVHKL